MITLDWKRCLDFLNVFFTKNKKGVKQIKYIINGLTSLAATQITWFFGGWDMALQVFLTMLFLDYITGICSAIYNHRINSEIGTKGIIKKFGYIVIVVIAVILDRIVGNTGVLRTLVIYFFVSNEGISILENWGKLNLPLPKKLFKVLYQLKQKDQCKEKEAETKNDF